jgi:hypothetical protein
MKKMYKNPEIEITEVAPQTIICASIGEGDPVQDPTFGDAPVRNVAPTVPGEGL